MNHSAPRKLLLVAALMMCVASQSQSCFQFPGVLITGFAIGGPRRAATPDACCKLCETTQTCIATSYSNGFCRLMGGMYHAKFVSNGITSCVQNGTLADLVAVALFTQSISGCTSPTWNFSLPVCTWYGIDCYNDRVISMTFDSMNCYGSPEWAYFPDQLQILHLGSNTFSGTPQLTNLPSTLQTLWLGYNTFSCSPACRAPLQS